MLRPDVGSAARRGAVRPAGEPAWVRRPATLAKAVTAELVERIVRGVHPSGTPLPPEPVLCETFSVSRTVVREAVKILQEKGLVQVRQGAGTMVTPPMMWDMLDELVLAATIDMDESLGILDDHVAYADLDRAFHDTIMQASGNRIARGVVRALESQVGNTARYTGKTERAQCVASNQGHRRIYERIAAQDPDGAADAMFRHITEAWLVRRSTSSAPVRLQR
ncbi:GntR family transcriptional regulator [Nonomuraea sp. NPDC048882]|uniref:FadR/GntR family transcriptional regulator n=1 Tax=Nonomuraea sp. NPDC048882 TaxID=3154347 RepID=UPI0033FC21E0